MEEKVSMQSIHSLRDAQSTISRKLDTLERQIADLVRENKKRDALLKSITESLEEKGILD